ncbi:LysR family transcriptional regulator [Actinocorallia populi]|uniref:LysR family transcriptional regulator n=1 Tax=Actinocorallia populi TaxID=2079200 RepID=UPI000D08B744|nr:LysR family transcriptional regulator [Actinocorallia populi]
MMDTLKLEAFVAVAEEESFGIAAARLRVAQSTVSSRIKELESFLGQRLFARTSRQVRLSPAGEAALPKARAALAALDGVRQAVDDVAGIRRGRVRLGLVAGADILELGEVLAAFAAEFPGVELVVTSASSSDLEQAVSAGTLDIAIVVRTGQTPLRWRELMRDPLTVVGLPPATASVPITDLRTRPLVVLDAGAGSRNALESAARRAGVHLEIAVQVSTPGMAWDLYSRGMGLLVVPRSLAPDGGSVVLDAEGTETSVRVGLISHPDVRTPATELLLERLAARMSPTTP